MLGATLLLSAASASASPVQSLQQQASQLSQQMLLEQLQIGGYQQQRTAALQEVDADQAQLAATQQRMAADHHRIGQDMVDLRTAAINAYVTGGTQSDATNPLFSSDTADGASTVYTQVMTGDLTGALHSLQSDRRALKSEVTSEAQLAAAAQKQEAQASSLLTDAQTTEATLAQQKANVTSQLAAAIAQQQQSQEQAATGNPPQGSPITGTSGTLPVLPPFLKCVIWEESRGEYQAVSPTGQYMGAFQFAQGTWNEAARLAGIPSLVGVAPYNASPRDQDLLAIALYEADGEQPWYDPCRS
ncbi:MAG: hypothetical protein ACRDWE_02850 [Acidimicrobiales bacterium]